MSEKLKLTQEQEAKKEAWLKDLADFVVEANPEMWPSDKGKIEPFLPGHKMHYYKREDWEVFDDYSGYFMAPGITIVNYKGLPAWHMYYGGTGVEDGHYGEAKKSITFLQEALKKVTASMPFRGPSEYREGNLVYRFKLLRGNIESCEWEEEVIEEEAPGGQELLYSQKGQAGIYISKDADRNPVYPWDR